MADEFKKLEDDVLSAEVRHDEHKIEAKREDINIHEQQKKNDHNKLLRDLRDAEIRHDEKVIERKEEAAARHEEKIKENEQEINHVK